MGLNTEQTWGTRPKSPTFASKGGAPAPDRLGVSSADAPDFCRQAQLVIGPDNKIVGFEVPVLQSEALEVADVLQQADQFEFASGKDAQSQKVYFTARSKNQKILIHYDVQGHRSILTRVSYFY